MSSSLGTSADMKMHFDKNVSMDMFKYLLIIYIVDQFEY